MKKDNIYNIMLVIALIIDLTIFGCLIYKTIKLEDRVEFLEDEIFRLATKLEDQGNNISEIEENQASESKTSDNQIIENQISNTQESNNLKDSPSQAKQDFNAAYDESVDNLDETVFLVDVENYASNNSEIKITKSQAKLIAQKGFDESKSRIAGEGADNEESETIELKDVSPNNYFTRHFYEYDEVYTEIKRKSYAVTRKNEMGNGITIYVDATTGLIIGGEAFGD